MMSKFLLSALAATSALTLCAPVHAQVLPYGYEQRTMTVRVDDVNLESAAGAHRMLARISYAANYVCGDASGIVDLTRRSKRNACVRATVDHALGELNNAHVSQLHVRAAGTALASR